MSALAPYWKFAQYVLLAVIGGTGAALFTAQGWTKPVLINALVLAITAAGVYLKSNSPTQPWAKTAVAVFGAGATVLASAWTDRHIDPAEWAQIATAVIAAIQVGVVANVPPGAQSATAAHATSGAPGVHDTDYPYSPGAADTL